jgi:hypothetical protein
MARERDRPETTGAQETAITEVHMHIEEDGDRAEPTRMHWDFTVRIRQVTTQREFVRMWIIRPDGSTTWVS